jgi:hypothetical protein
LDGNERGIYPYRGGNKLKNPMPNFLKYSASAQTLALKKGNFWIGTGDVGKGPTSTTDYWNGISPPSGGYTIYLNKASNGPSIFRPQNSAELISLTNNIAGASYSTAAQCLDYFSAQTDMMVFNIEYEPIVTNGLVLNLDAGFTPSYPTTGTTWYDLSGNSYNATLTNGPTFNSGSGGSIVFDGSDDFVKTTAVNGTGIMNPTLYGEVISANVWLRSTSTQASQYAITSGAYTGTVTGICLVVNDGGVSGNEFVGITTSTKRYVSTGNNFVSVNEWVNVCFTIDGTNMYVYKNGSLIATESGGSNNGGSNNAGLQLSGPNNSPGLLFVGNIAITQIYNRTLSAAEVSQNYNSQKSRFGL